MTQWLIGAILAIVYTVGAVTIGYHFGGQHEVVKTDTQTIKTAASDVAQVQHQDVIVNEAETVHDQEVEHPPALNIPQPVRVCPSASVRVVQVPAKAPSGDPSIGGADQGPTVDLRPALAAFALKYENALSDCRRMAAEWPQ